MCQCRLIVLLCLFMLCTCVFGVCVCVCVCTCCSMLAVNCMAWWCCCSSMSMWRSSRKSFLSSSIQPSSSWDAVGRRDASLDANIQLQSLRQKNNKKKHLLLNVLHLFVGMKTELTLKDSQYLVPYVNIWGFNMEYLYWDHTHDDLLITWISGLATSREIFWFPSLVSSATASSRFWISTPLILRDRWNY